MARFLVVEDDPWSQHLVCEVLRMEGHEVRAASTVQHARVELANKPDAVLLDIHIPGGGGEGFLREIRATPDLGELPVIALTASAMQGDRERFLSQGFTGYLSKPIDVRTFCKSILDMIQGPS
jgi:two-component system cell cycle response regulator DivK